MIRIGVAALSFGMYEDTLKEQLEKLDIETVGNPLDGYFVSEEDYDDLFRRITENVCGTAYSREEVWNPHQIKSLYPDIVLHKFYRRIRERKIPGVIKLKHPHADPTMTRYYIPCETIKEWLGEPNE